MVVPVGRIALVGKRAAHRNCVDANRERGVRFVLRVEAGVTHVIDHTVDDTPTGPFGGEKNSGPRRFGGDGILHELAHDHWVIVRHCTGPYPF
jgi:aldehyde dehydrogenase (NAD+)